MSKGRVFEGILKGEGLRFAIVVSRFNEFISSKLLSGAWDCLTRHGADEADIDVAWVPGAIRDPAGRAAAGRHQALRRRHLPGRGHPRLHAALRLRAAEVAKGVAKVQLDAGMPVIFGVLTTDTIEQAVERAGTKAGNKGWDAAVSALEMANLLRRLERSLAGV